MQFNSIEFLFYFLPLFLAVFWIFPEDKRNIPLVVGSLLFYFLSGGGNFWWVGLLAVCTLFTYLAGRTLVRPAGRYLLALYLGLMAALLIFFKLHQGGSALPAGMSFYLFQMAAYLIDVYRRRTEPVRNILSYSEQIVMFPKLLSGPLVQPGSLKSGKPSGEQFRSGLHLLILGLGLKVVLANRVGSLWTEVSVIGYASVSVPLAWAGLIAYVMQLFYDFYGYSLMAVGLGRMLGYELPHNFLDPYASGSVSEFFRRWHATLGAWFREYLYIPLGGNRKGKVRTIFNIAVVWLFTGLWHGIGGNYLLWAGSIFLFVVLERVILGKMLARSRVTKHIYTISIILLSWIPFAIGDWDQMRMFFGKLFGLAGTTINPLDFVNMTGDYVWLLGMGVILATPFPRRLWQKARNSVWADIALFFLFWLVVYYISTAAQDPFMYFQF